MPQYTIKETKDLLVFGLSLAKVLRIDLADSKISITEWFDFIKLIGPAQDAFKGISDVPKELLDLSSEESAELADIVRQVLEQDLTDTAALAKAEQVISAMQSLLSMVAMLRGTDQPAAA